MKITCNIGILLVLALSPLSAQVASHAPASKPQTSVSPVMPAVTGKPVARVNGTVLTDRDLRREMYHIFPYAKQHNGAFPKSMEADIRAGAMKMIVFEELVYEEAVREKVSIPPAQMAKALAAFRHQFRSESDYRQFMQNEAGNSEKVLQAKIRRSLLIDKFLKTRVTDRATVTPQQVRTFYLAHPEQFRYADSIAFQSISFLPQGKAGKPQDARKRAEAAATQVRTAQSYEAFGTLAEKISEDDYRVRMGDHRAVESSTLPPAVVQTARALKPGEISGLVQVDDAYCYIRLVAKVPAGIRPFEQMRDPIHSKMVKDKMDKLRNDLDHKLRDGAKIELL
ncbi:MAG: peptidylprolyl isomerase [Acidobacteriota bacterium]|nr:peptidylprolyl isomerase [Acidobacteriota bacterium]